MSTSFYRINSFAQVETFYETLLEFRELTLRESRSWNRYYLTALDAWRIAIRGEIEKLKQLAEMLEPITTNIYRPGEALHPETDSDIFIGREDLKEELSFEILTARSMPMFLIQGQRRVGKTSLLNFLPPLLGPQFKIIYQDLQGLTERSVNGWLKDLLRLINKALLLTPETAWNPPNDWLLSWQEFKEYLHIVSRGRDFKFILALDEYEILHEDIFQNNPEKAKHLLGAIRSFTQSQNQIVFLFVGVKFFDLCK